MSHSVAEEAAEPFLALRVASARWDSALSAPAETVERAAIAALAAAGASCERCALSVLLTDDAEIAGLNQRFRGREVATNVLSWPTFSLPAPLDAATFGALVEAQADEDAEARLFLGDVALAFETVRKEAESERKTLEAHLSHLIVHGVLHLLGYAHETEDEAEAMAAREIAALSAVGVADPYH